MAQPNSSWTFVSPTCVACTTSASIPRAGVMTSGPCAMPVASPPCARRHSRSAGRASGPQLTSSDWRASCAACVLAAKRTGVNTGPPAAQLYSLPTRRSFDKPAAAPDYSNAHVVQRLAEATICACVLLCQSHAFLCQWNTLQRFKLSRKGRRRFLRSRMRSSSASYAASFSSS